MSNPLRNALRVNVLSNRNRNTNGLQNTNSETSEWRALESKRATSGLRVEPGGAVSARGDDVILPYLEGALLTSFS